MITTPKSTQMTRNPGRDITTPDGAPDEWYSGLGWYTFPDGTTLLVTEAVQSSAPAGMLLVQTWNEDPRDTLRRVINMDSHEF